MPKRPVQPSGRKPKPRNGHPYKPPKRPPAIDVETRSRHPLNTARAAQLPPIPVIAGIVHFGGGRPPLPVINRHTGEITHLPRRNSAGVESASAALGTHRDITTDDLWKLLNLGKATPSDQRYAAEWLVWLDQFVPIMARLDRAMGIVNHAYGEELTSWPAPGRTEPQRPKRSGGQRQK